MTRLSIIIPGYNTPQSWWQRCIGSILSTIKSNDEIVCIDDGSAIPVESSWFSSDGKQVDSRIKIFRKENAGQASARNMGIDCADGKFIAFVDSDDFVLPGAYDACIAKMEECNADVSVFGVKVEWRDEGLTLSSLPPNSFIGNPDSRFIEELRDLKLFNYPVNKVFRKDFLVQKAILFNPN